MYLERAICEHGPYTAAVARVAMLLRRLGSREQGASSDLLELSGRDLGVMIGHFERLPLCPACNLASGLQPFERDFLEAHWQFEQTENTPLFSKLRIQVCFDDASDVETVEDPLARYANGLMRKMMLGVRKRAAESLFAHGMRSFMYH